MAMLVYRGGSTLTFGTESGGRRTVKHGELFEVSDMLATALLADPHISVATADEASSDGGADAPRETTLAEKTKAELQAIAAELGLELRRRATNPELVASIEAERQRLADEASTTVDQASSDGEGDQGGEDAPGGDPEASAAGEPGTPPSTGAVTLGDFGDGTRIARETS